MTDTMEHTEQQPTVNRAKLNLVFMGLLDELADRIDERFPMGKTDSAEHVANYQAKQQAFGNIERVLTAVPADQAFRSLLWEFLQRAWDLTTGDPAHDVTVDRAVTRAKADYQTDTPEALKREQIATKATSNKVQASSKAGPK